MEVTIQQSQPTVTFEPKTGVVVLRLQGGLPGPQGPAGTGNGSLPSPPDQTGTWAPIFVAGVLQWFEVVLIAGGGVTGQDGSAAAVGAELSGQTGSASATGAGATTATGSAATSEAGAATPTGTGTVAAAGSEGSAETGTATPYVLNPGSAAATGTQASAETGTATATGSGTTAATGTEGTAEAGTATASAISSGSASATDSEGAAQTGTASATGNGTAAATGTAATSETGTATASGGGGSTITENFDTTIALTYSATAYPADMAATATVQGWTIGSSGTNPGTFGAYDWFYGANILTAAGGFAGNGLFVTGCHTEDADSNVIGYSGFKATKVWTGTFSSGTFALKYKAATGTPTMTIKVNGVPVGTLTQNSAWQTATISLTSPASITLEIECAPTANAIGNTPQIVIDSVTYS